MFSFTSGHQEKKNSLSRATASTSNDSHGQSTGRDDAVNRNDPGGAGNSNGPNTSHLPTVSLPKGGGAIRGLGEKFSTNPQTGAASLSIPIPTTPARGGSNVSMALQFSSVAGNGPFGFGWHLSIPSITRKTDKGLPQYLEDIPEDVFVLAGEDDLVPVLEETRSGWVPVQQSQRGEYLVKRYRPRTEGSFHRIERWVKASDRSDIFWRAISRDNITSTFGRTSNAQILSEDEGGDGTVVRRIYSWLLSDTYDRFGNAALYTYQQDDLSGIHVEASHEVNRTNAARQSNRYLKSIKYGNRQPNRTPDTWLAFDPHGLPSTTPDGESAWMFTVVLDYGDHNPTNPQPNPDTPSPVRTDPFSTYRAGFEIRTYRLCHRVMMFHHFSGELHTPAHLVTSVEFQYTGSPYATFLTSATHWGHTREADGVPHKKSLPPLEFGYSQPPDLSAISSWIQIHELPRESAENLPHGIDGKQTQWLDLNGEGAPGVMYEAGTEWFYKRNVSAKNIPRNTLDLSSVVAELGPVKSLESKPPGITLQATEFVDVDGDGFLEALNSNPTHGIYPRTDSGDWLPFRALESYPNVDLTRWDVKRLDVTGDGLTDILVANLESISVFQSRGLEGFDSPVINVVPWELSGNERYSIYPRLPHADSSLYVADLSGDGMPDLAHVCNGQVIYYPSLGFGQFGLAVHMANSPVFVEDNEKFDPQRLRFADVDGSGVADLLYLGEEGVGIWLNEAGNGWSDGYLIQGLRFERLGEVAVVDLLGKGTGCLVWSERLGCEIVIKYIDLMNGGVKPHLLTSVRNNVGVETRVEYRPSTAFYLDDLEVGKPWATKLPLVVHCVARSEVFDHISESRYVTKYAYHHGCFDGVERDFCGFALVEQWDTETTLSTGPVATGQPISLPPIHTKTWYHTGVEPGSGSKPLLHTLATEFFGAPRGTHAQLDDFIAKTAEGPFYDRRITPHDSRDAIRCLKGTVLRHEAYSDDNSPKADLPFSISQHIYSIQMIQNSDPNTGAAASMMLLNSGYRNEEYDRNPGDPRVSQQFNLEYDKWGNVLKSVSIALGRQQEDVDIEPRDREKQGRTVIEYEEMSLTQDIDSEDDYLIRSNCETKAWEVVGLKPENGDTYRFHELTGVNLTKFSELEDVPFEDFVDRTKKQRRLIEWTRTLYRADDLSGFLPFGSIGSLKLLGETYKLALTPGLISMVFQRNSRSGGWQPPEQLIPDPKAVLEGTGKGQGGYIDLNNDGQWWVASGREFYHENPTATTVEELAEARHSFFTVRRIQTPFKDYSTVKYDWDHLLVIETVDSVKNTITSQNDYRFCQPYLVTDANGNHTEVAFDALGMVVGSAGYGKTTAEGDNLDRFIRHPNDALLAEYFASPKGEAAYTLLGNATSRFVYDLDRYYKNREDTTRKWPTYTSTIMRETHVSKTSPGVRSVLQVSFSYSDGVGREAQRKIQGDAKNANRAWVGSGTNIYNNKGLIFRQYEPFFDGTHEYWHGRLEGPSSTFLYDSLSRLVATLHPDHTWEKTVFTPWKQSTWDACDTVLLDPQADPDVGYLFKALPSGDYQPSWLDPRKNNQMGPGEAINAQKAEAHANTPTVLYMDSQGRTFLTVADNGPAGKYKSRGELNIDGSQRSIEDARGRAVIEYEYDMLGGCVHQSSMESGEGWTLPDSMSRTIISWDSVGHRVRTFYDGLGRSVANLVRKVGETNEILERKIQYGDSLGLDPTFATERNLRGQIYTSWDQAGKAVNLSFDFKGHLDKSQRYLAVDYKHTLDWNIDQLLDPRPPYEGSTEIDALGRSLIARTADNSAVRYSYNDAGFLERLEVDIKGAGAGPWKPIVKQITYTVRGSRSSIEFGNGVKTTVEHDDLTRHIRNLTTTRPTGRGGTETLQNLTYIHDPVGNITLVKDTAQQDIYFRNQIIEPSNDYTYDAVYRLIRATGREHLGQAVVAGRPNSPTPPAQFNDFHTRLLHPGDGNAMGLYIESYDYDVVGNIKAMKHDSSDRTMTGWTRTYTYNEPSQLGGPEPNNRLSTTEVNGITESYRYDDKGNMVSMSKLPLLQWNHRNQLEASSKQIVNAGTPETTHYVYSEGGQRVRKVTESFAAEGQAPKLMNERIYLGAGLQIYREYTGDGMMKLERETLHVNDDVGMVCLVESRTVGSADDGLARLFRYQLVTQSGSVAIEVDEEAQIITYEEYTPYGSTSFQGVRNLLVETPKIYRYSGAELDDETGLSYHGARYYFTILGIWISADPASLGGGVNMYCYAGCNPVMRKDKNGAQWVDIGDDPGVQASASAAHADPRPDIANAPAKPSVPTTPPPATLKDARKPAANMQRRVRNAVKRTGVNLPSHVQVGHEIPVAGSMQSGIANSVRDDPNRTMLVNSSRTLGNESGSIDNGAGGMSTYTKHNLQEAHLEDVTNRSMSQGGMSHAEAQVNASNQVHFQHENTHLDWRNAQSIVNGGETSPAERAEVNAEAARIRARESGGSSGGHSGGGGTSSASGTPHASSSTTLPSAPHTPNTSSAPHAPSSTPHTPSTPHAPSTTSHAPSFTPKPPGKISTAVGVAASMAESLAPEGFAEAEVALSYASTMAGAAGHTTTSLVLGSTAKAVPVVGAAMVAGGVGGYVGEKVTSLVSDDPATIRTGGALGAIAAGAGIGAVVGAPAGGVGAVPGAVIGGAVGLATYLLGW
ncbi:insecticidal toxin complex protein [Dendryphion nanum]|uniref:Insecticidal toxin complex protein n=1 Tax=Dendryphion nanum TaxID=256645 RepID=A0A9P9EKJ5_9PLEO|nr:insecticidal toxin complex protein [Dendryphion nanum]